MRKRTYRPGPAGKAATTAYQAVILGTLLAACAAPSGSASATPTRLPMQLNTVTDHSKFNRTLELSLQGQLAITWTEPGAGASTVVLSPQPKGPYATLASGYSGTMYVSTENGLWLVHPDGTTQIVFQFQPTNVMPISGPYTLKSDLTESGYRQAMADFAATRIWWEPQMQMTGADPASAGHGAANYYNDVSKYLAPAPPHLYPTTVTFAATSDTPAQTQTYTGAPTAYIPDPAADFRTPNHQSFQDPWTLSASARQAMTGFVSDPAIVAALFTTWPITVQ